MKEELEKQGYTHLREVEGRGWCGLFNFIFTVGLCYGLDESGYRGRYCYPDSLDAKQALKEWDGIGDPHDEFWIKHKGDTQYRNPKSTEVYYGT